MILLSTFHLDMYCLSMLSLGCNFLSIVIGFLFYSRLSWAPPSYILRRVRVSYKGSAQVFIPLMRFMQLRFYFCDKCSRSSEICLFLSFLLVWSCIVFVIFLFSKWYDFLLIWCFYSFHFFLLIIMWMAHFSGPYSSLYLGCIFLFNVSESAIFSHVLRTVWWHPLT